MLQSTVTKTGQTTIPDEVRDALRIRPGSKLEYRIAGDHAVIRLIGGAAALHGALASDKGKGMTFSQIRAAAAAKKRRERVK